MWRGMAGPLGPRLHPDPSRAPGPRRIVQVHADQGKVRNCEALLGGRPVGGGRGKKFDEAIDLAEARSACTCEQCGKRGRLFNRGGWFMTACDEHGKGEPVAERRDFEQVHAVYHIVDGQPVASGRRYDRSTDSFVDIHPGSLQIEEE